MQCIHCCVVTTIQWCNFPALLRQFINIVAGQCVILYHQSKGIAKLCMHGIATCTIITQCNS